jgi:hypothetical protein
MMACFKSVRSHRWEGRTSPRFAKLSEVCSFAHRALPVLLILTISEKIHGAPNRSGRGGQGHNNGYCSEKADAQTAQNPVTASGIALMFKKVGRSHKTNQDREEFL